MRLIGVAYVRVPRDVGRRLASEREAAGELISRHPRSRERAVHRLVLATKAVYLYVMFHATRKHPA